MDTIVKILTTPFRSLGSLISPGKTSRASQLTGSLLSRAFLLNLFPSGTPESLLDGVKDFATPVLSKVNPVYESAKYGLESLYNKIIFNR